MALQMPLARRSEDRDTGAASSSMVPLHRPAVPRGLAWPGEETGTGFPDSQDLAE